MIRSAEKIYYKDHTVNMVDEITDVLLKPDSLNRPVTALKDKDRQIDQLRIQLSHVFAYLWQFENLCNRLEDIVDSMLESEHPLGYTGQLRRLSGEYNRLLQKAHFDGNLSNGQEFMRRLKNEFCTLSSNDLRICSLLRLNLSTKEIAHKLGISPESANKARYRIRRKLNLSRGDDLVQFIFNY